jgi:hypothetical protein
VIDRKKSRIQLNNVILRFLFFIFHYTRTTHRMRLTRAVFTPNTLATALPVKQSSRLGKFFFGFALGCVTGYTGLTLLIAYVAYSDGATCSTGYYDSERFARK